ncbi:unnamed protein product [Didymodactylos carnosus]|nr:unnamed protein product [Didymodactylos carnosus]CAF3698532.1 unnamed protein product [Didymodactylos carnosus]
MFAQLKLISFITPVIVGIGFGFYFAYLTIQSDFDEKQQPQNVEPRIVKTSSSSNPLPDISSIINSAQNTWQLIEQNRAVMNIKVDYANVLPSEIKSAFDCQKWADEPFTKTFKIKFQNKLNMRIMELVYTVQFTYGGSFENKGQYLDRITIIPTHVYVAYGFKLDASINIPSINNVGTLEEPIAAAYVELKYRLTGMNSIEKTESFFVKGNGQFKYLNQW